jgi:hypothetical protein
MEQRRLRLGDILDDYCPRERRLTNHAVVAMIEEDVKQTRCTTCDAEHAYKGGKLPRRRRKETPSALYNEVLAGHLAPDAPPAAPAGDPEPLAVEIEATPEPMSLSDDSSDDVRDSAPLDEPEEIEQEPQPQIEEGPVHRPLIRAQLPRIEGQKEERRLPEFTIRQRAGGNGHFRGAKPHRAGGHAANGGNGNRPHGGPRFAGGRGPAGRGAGGGFRAGQPSRPGGGGRKRSR